MQPSPRPRQPQEPIDPRASPPPIVPAPPVKQPLIKPPPLQPPAVKRAAKPAAAKPAAEQQAALVNDEARRKQEADQQARARREEILVQHAAHAASEAMGREHSDRLREVQEQLNELNANFRRFFITYEEDRATERENFAKLLSTKTLELSASVKVRIYLR
jgi:hypothetical protein